MAKYYLPGIGGQTELPDNKTRTPYQSAPLLNTYSPRLFGAPPQLTHLNDMRLLSSNPEQENTPGPVGDFYLTKILQNSQIANFVVGRAVFTGGTGGVADVIRTAAQYANAASRFDIFNSTGDSVYNENAKTAQAAILQEATLDAYNSAMNEPGELKTTTDEDGNTIADLSESKGLIDNIVSLITNSDKNAAMFSAALMTSLSVQQPFYTFESDWYTYINNVKMMINTAVVMLGLQNACVRIGDNYYPIGMGVDVTPDNDVWSNYRFITPTSGLGDVTQFDHQTGDTSQYVSFMIDSLSANESYNNTIGDSQVYSITNTGSNIGSEIAFLTHSSANQVDDVVMEIAGETVTAAQDVLSALSGGVGRFTAAVAGSMARSFIGDHTIYPKVFQGYSSTTSMSVTVKLRSDGDPYSYLVNQLVPFFFILGMALPKMSKNNAAAYAFPPLIQCNIPGLWGTRLGMVESINVVKNPGGKDVSVHGYPLSMDVTINICDLQHVLLTSGMNEMSTFLNNHTMFDYIAQCAGVDKYRVNGSIRLVSRLALAASVGENFMHNLGDALLTDFTSFANRLVHGKNRL